MQITLQLCNIYGQTKAYPMCDKAKIFAKIAGTKTLTRVTLCQIDALGYSFANRTVTQDEPVSLVQLMNVLDA